MNGNNTFAERNKEPSKGEMLFEQYCKDRNVEFKRLGFDQHGDQLPFFWQINPLIRNLPDYYVITKTRAFFVMVKGTANMRSEEHTSELQSH